MPINREDGRHWCAPDLETPDAQGRWICPECNTTWVFSTDTGTSLWETASQHDARLQAEAEAAVVEAPLPPRPEGDD